MSSCKFVENHFIATNSTQPSRRFSCRGHRKARMKPLINSPTAGVASLNFLTHTHLPPSFSCNTSSLLSRPAPHSPLSHPLIPSSSFTVIQPPGPNTGGIHGGGWVLKHLFKQQAFCDPVTGAHHERITFLSRCPDTENWSFCAGHKERFLPGLYHWRCAESSRCMFLHVSGGKKKSSVGDIPYKGVQQMLSQNWGRCLKSVLGYNLCKWNHCCWLFCPRKKSFR